MAATTTTHTHRQRVRRRPHAHLIKHAMLEDMFLLAVSLLVAVFLAVSGAVSIALSFFDSANLVAIVIAGFFSASTFTIAPAAVALAELADTIPAWTVIFVGAAGAVAGDLVLFYIIKDHFVDDIIALLSKHKNKTMENIVGSTLFHRLMPLIGAFIIASPLPDELGLAMMGISKTNRGTLIAISYSMNVICIATIVGISKLF